MKKKMKKKDWWAVFVHYVCVWMMIELKKVSVVEGQRVELRPRVNSKNYLDYH